MKKPTLKSFSLIEILIFITIFNIFLISAIAVNLTLIRNLKFQEEKIKAVFLAEQSLEWLRGEKEKNWGGNIAPQLPNDSFTYKITNVLEGPGEANKKNICLNQLNWSNINDSCQYVLNNKFKRSANIYYINNPIFQIIAEIKIEWNNLGQNHEVKLNHLFAQWE